MELKLKNGGNTVNINIIITMPNYVEIILLIKIEMLIYYFSIL